MRHTNKSLVAAFVNGETSGRCNRMEIVEGPREHEGSVPIPEGYTAIVGYGWAVYAVRTPGGRVNIHNGWETWAMGERSNNGIPTTVRHMRLISQLAGPTAIATARRPQVAKEPSNTGRICSA